MGNAKVINQFCSYIRTQIVDIDCLSRVYSRGDQRNKKRFLTFIKNCIQWEHSEIISISMLYYKIINNKIPFNYKMINYISTKSNEMSYGRIYRLEEIDPFVGEIENFIKNQEERRIIFSSSHNELFYTFRNNLIHEFRRPGNGMEISNDNESPYYHGFKSLRSQRDTWELVYPTQFFINLAIEGVSSLEKFLVCHDFDPYSFFKFGSPWN